MAISYFLKRNQKLFTTQKDLKAHLENIRDKYKETAKKYIENEEEISDLLDYLEDIHPDSVIFREQFNLENCNFYVDISPDGSKHRRQTKCLHVIDCDGKVKHFGLSTFSAPTPRANFANLCRNLVAEIKLEIRKSKLEENQRLEDYDLIHIFPKFSDIVDNFVQQNNLDLSKVVSENGSGNNIPKLNQGFEYLADEFKKFYKEQYSDISTQYELKKIKS